MSKSELDEFVDNAEAIYDSQFREQLELDHLHEFVAIEPISGEYFLGNSVSEAIGAAREAHPDRLAHAMRIGHRAALHFGMQVR